MKQILLSLLLSIAVIGNVQARDITFGIVPQQSAITLANNWGPILEYVSQQSGYNLVFRTAKDIPEFEGRVLTGEYDVAYMNPYHYTVFHQKPGYQAFAKQKDKRIHGILVVKKDTSITSLEELDGKRLAFPSPAAFAASVVPRAALKNQGINITPQYVSSHDSVYLNVARDFFIAGGGIERTFNNTDPEVSKQLRVLWKTPGYTPHAFAFHPDLDPQVADAIKAAFLSLNNSEKGQTLLGNISFKGIEPAQNEDWDDVRALNITLLQHLLSD
ncbi:MULTISPECIES: phosphate/phosphite/phosphonate ABC transporter substrate-binding protein [unclassified Salinivibrio]|uniref:phosphate/phosphite/phosphonate ABC transporter substrate-binding protein n=1 Tax=unclassified Salinivibrio TaxID=2636825 RepID=UPI00128CB70D|nr:MULTISPECIES: phosphate/phosphite/phosphonate ABC transporter substrate-binding protein [unclassified Salinivibrio]MPS30921.1 phosphate/phosphite/phosphonate ABC transporter substrate-binding protein [Salinivibrio sp. VYel7]MPX89538.1 phosphate/phosphite/phosphonate ABC transporter substrate-binding protein [Salinivibrio sp. VYel1]MPX92322.1 phosphate/phosphite/phosphonate ABC transporter substrate-binding protein [Salinivibrio sp. VYel9]MPX97102.1 phosphate/phosphite/phosphonate ABC transpo